jgi:Protein of unknown function (DUF1810)
MTEPDLIPFVNAQAQVYGRVVEELTDGRKRTHWIWFIFPQLAGLGHSEKDRLFFAGRHVPDDHSLAVGGVEYRLFWPFA